MNNQDTEQYYPTPPEMVAKMQKKFKIRLNGSKAILDPTCGTGNCLKYDWNGEKKIIPADACEVNAERLSYLAGKSDINLVGHDFLNFESNKQYTHIIMNPPFNVGHKFLLKAWDLLNNGEIVCLLNGDSYQNSTSRDYQYIRELVGEQGDVEFHDLAFASEETQRKTNVRTAMVYLSKKTPIDYSYLDGLKLDTHHREFKETVQTTGDLAIPDNVIENAVINYNAALEILARKVESAAVLNAAYAAKSRLFSESLIESQKEKTHRKVHESRAFENAKPEAIAADFNSEMASLKKRAWHYILTGIGFYKTLSQKAEKTFITEFEKVAQLEFTESNIHGFLAGVAMNRTAMTDEMMLSLFDKFTERCHDNRDYYRSWKSNAKHRSAAWRIKMTRIILPIRVRSEWGDGFDYHAERELHDLDKCLAALDGGKDVKDTFGLCDAMKENRHNGRFSSDYFEYRCYSSTLHLFPKRKDLIDRLNRTVGRLRTWLPEDDKDASPEFWKNYNSKETTKEIEKDAARGGMRLNWLHDERDVERLCDVIDDSMTHQGLDPDKFAARIESKSASREIVIA